MPLGGPEIERPSDNVLGEGGVGRLEKISYCSREFYVYLDENL